MRDVITIADTGEVRMISISNERVIGLGDLEERMGRRFPVSTPILPTGAIFYSEKLGKSIITMESPPTKRRILFRAEHGQETLALHVQLPYVYSSMIMDRGSLSDMYIHFRSKPMVRKDDELFGAPLPNMYEDGRVCLGGMKYTMGGTLRERCEAIHSAYWDSGFNSDLAIPNMPEEWKIQSGSRTAFILDHINRWNGYKSVENISWVKAKPATFEEFVVSKVGGLE